jgi:thymidylate kinase
VPALTGLLDELADRGVRYCHWKSNEHLAAGLAGRTDLDLLVHLDDLDGFRDALRRAGLKELVPHETRRFPGMEHRLGFDRRTGRLFHLHIHEQLVLGEEHVKNHRVPLEDAFLGSAREQDGVPVPSPDLELGVLSVRALLKYRDRDVVKDVLGIRTPGLDRLRSEFEWLLARTTAERVGSSLHAAGDAVPSNVIVRFLETYQRDPRAGATFFLLRRRLRSSLRGLQRQSRMSARARRAIGSWRRWRGPAPRMTIPGSAPTIALVGADGSGKSTLGRELAAWLGWKVDVRLHYLGSKSPSQASRWTYLAFRVLRRSHRSVTRSVHPDSIVARGLANVRDVVLGVHYLAIGHDRIGRAEEGRRDARAGRVVLFDRFPLTALSDTAEHLILDGPRIRAALGSDRRIVRTLAAREERLYGRFGSPDRLVILDVSPPVSSARKPDHVPEILAAKVRAARGLAEIAEERGVTTIRIDADRPLDAVLLELKEMLWDAL